MAEKTENLKSEFEAFLKKHNAYIEIDNYPDGKRKARPRMVLAFNDYSDCELDLGSYFDGNKIPAYTGKADGWTVDYTLLKEIAIQVNSVSMEDIENIILELEREGYVELARGEAND